jgi:hypothetical protein
MMAKWRNVLVGARAVAAGGAVAWYARERNTPEPAYRSLRLDKQFELRDYPRFWDCRRWSIPAHAAKR